MVELFIANEAGNRLYMPAAEGNIEWITERWGTPGKLTFKIVGDSRLDFSEGSQVQLRVNQAPVFFGFVFKQSRDKAQMVTVTAYDQLRYLKNKDTFIYEGKTAAQVVEMLAADYSLKTGILEDTKYTIPSRVEEDATLFDIIGNALDLTLTNAKEMFVLYDDFGKLTLRNIASMRVGKPGAYLMIDEETGENFQYTSSIDDSTYNKVVLKNDSTNKDFKVSHDLVNIKRWGTLVYTGTYKGNENGQAKADALLQLYNKKTRNLKITNAVGDIRVRGGSMLVVNLDLGDMAVRNFMMVERVKHTFGLDSHFMDLTLRGGEFIA